MLQPLSFEAPNILANCFKKFIQCCRKLTACVTCMMHETIERVKHVISSTMQRKKKLISILRVGCVDAYCR